MSYPFQKLQESIAPILRLVKDAMEPPATNVTSDPDEAKDEFTDEERRPLLHAHRFLSPAITGRYPEPREVLYERSTSIGPENWVQEFEMMNLPLFSQQYIQLIHVPLDVMHECLRLQLEMKMPIEPSTHSVKQVRLTCTYMYVYTHAYTCTYIMLHICTYAHMHTYSSLRDLHQ